MESSYVFLLSLGKMSYVDSGDGKTTEEVFEGVSYGEVNVLRGFQLSTDDPRNYTDKLSIITKERYFPEESYPAGSDPEHQLLLLHLVHQLQETMQDLPHQVLVQLQAVFP